MLKKFLIFTALLLTPTLVQASNSLEVTKLIVTTAENDSPYGDAIKVIYNQPITQSSWNQSNDPRVGSGATLPLAPAGYDDGHNSSSKAAKNYTIQVIPETGNMTQPFTGTWASLGGKVIFDPYDPTHKTAILIPPTTTSQFFKPGDTVKITVVQTVTDLANHTLDPNKDNQTNRAS